MENNEKNIPENNLGNTVEIQNGGDSVEQLDHLPENTVETAEGTLVPNLENPLEPTAENLQDETASDDIRREPEIKAGILDYLSDLVFDPKSLGQSIKKNPKIFVPIIAVAVLTLLSILIPKGLVEQYILDSFRAQMPDAPTEILLTQTRIGSTVALFTSPLSVLVISLISAAFLRWMASLFGGDGTYKHILSIVLFASILYCIGGVLAGIGKLLTGNFFFDFSAAALLDDASFGKWYYSLLQTLNPFVLWHYYVLIIGMREINDFSTKTAIKAVVIMVAVGKGLGILASLVSAAMTGAM